MYIVKIYKNEKNCKMKLTDLHTNAFGFKFEFVDNKNKNFCNSQNEYCFFDVGEKIRNYMALVMTELFT